MSSSSSGDHFERDLEEMDLRQQIAREASDADALDEIWSDGLVISTNTLLLCKERILKRILDCSIHFKRFERSPSNRRAWQFRGNQRE